MKKTTSYHLSEIRDEINKSTHSKQPRHDQSIRLCVCSTGESHQTGERTFELYVEAAEFQLHSLQSLSKRFMVMTDGLLGARAEGQREILVCLLSVVVRPHCVHP